jgi:hypothetical protein
MSDYKNLDATTDVDSLIGQKVSVLGKSARIPMQHMLALIHFYEHDYIDTEASQKLGQIVVYYEKKELFEVFPEEKNLKINGTLHQLKSGVYSGYYLQYDSFEILD